MIKRTKNNMTGNNLDLLIINKYNINKYYIVIKPYNHIKKLNTNYLNHVSYKYSYKS